MGLEYTGIRVRDLERASRFYSEGLGLKVRRSGRMAAGGLWRELEDPETGAVLELNFYPGEPAYHEGDELDHLGFRVASLDSAVARLTALGATIRIPPFWEGKDRLVFLADPDGVWIELYETTGDDEPPTSRAGA